MTEQTLPRTVYSPGCTLLIHKPHLAEKVLAYLNTDPNLPAGQQVTMHTRCCKNDPKLPEGSTIITSCSGCSKRYNTLYTGIRPITLWEVIAARDDFPFPDYHGAEITIHDACDTRNNPKVHDAVRELLRRMNFTIIEPEFTREHSKCCGDSFFYELPIEQVHEKMRERAQSMPVEDVAVYCISCVKSLSIGGRTPHFLIDLLYNEPTDVGVADMAEWHSQIRAFSDAHSD